MLSAEQIKKFQILYERRFEQQISEAQALEMGTKLAALVKLTCSAQTGTQQKRNEENKYEKREKPGAIQPP